VIGSSLIDIAAGVVLIAIDYDTVRSLLRVLPASDVDWIADVLTAAGGAMLAIGALCLAAIPQAIRYGKFLRSEPSPASTNPGWHRAPVKGSMWHMPAAVDERRTRRRLYFALGGFAIGFGAGVGVLVTSAAPRASDTPPIASKPPTKAPPPA